MTLDTYKQKRSFDRTPEPIAGESFQDKLQFVVQKHHASHLHYDFRIEARGVLKSWAIPKGPSMNPEEKRLAQEVEDHPFDYKDFEGIIPEGNYGAGTVIVWDKGYYEPVEKLESKEEQEKWVLHNYYKGEITVVLFGEKLNGKFQLKRKKERGKNAWVLSKSDDEYALKSDILDKDRSVVSGLTIEEMAENENAAEWKSNRTSNKLKGKTEEKDVLKSDLIKDCPKSAHPEKVAPMLAASINEAFNKEGWVYELKLDGYRIIAHWFEKNLVLHSRKLLNYTKYYPSVAEEFKKLNHNVVLDGEIVAINDEGKPDFDLLQVNKGLIQYYVFDVFWIDGYDTTGLPLSSRKELLKEILPESNIIKFSAAFSDGVALYNTVKEQGLEGIVAKKEDSIYEPGVRSKNWLKITTDIVKDFVVGAWTESESGNAFRSLIFGTFENNQLLYVGHVGGGFKDKERELILKRLKKLEVDKSPFLEDVDTETKAHWVRPEMVIAVRFATYTRAGNIRKPATFLRVREDKAPSEVKGEKEFELKEIEESPQKRKENLNEVEISSESNWSKIDEEKVTSEGTLNIEGHQVRVTNIEKTLWKDVTKASLLQYYGEIASFILPHLKNRPLSLHIKNIAPTVSGFYIKDMEGRQPDFADIFSIERKHKKSGKRDVIDYLVCNNEATLLYVINLGCIDLNPWTARTSYPDHPDYIVIDLDPSDDDFKKVIRAAQAAKEVFEEHKLKSFVKTSGKTGMHLLLPCMDINFHEARLIAEQICKEINTLVPEITTTEVSIKKRGSLLYLDPNQNDFADTIASAYSVRPHKIPTVSTPLKWSEVNYSLNSTGFTMDVVKKRLLNYGDLFNDLYNEKIRHQNTIKLRKSFLQ